MNRRFVETKAYKTGNILYLLYVNDLNHLRTRIVLLNVQIPYKIMLKKSKNSIISV